VVQTFAGKGGKEGEWPKAGREWAKKRKGQCERALVQTAWGGGTPGNRSERAIPETVCLREKITTGPKSAKRGRPRVSAGVAAQVGGGRGRVDLCTNSGYAP